MSKQQQRYRVIAGTSTRQSIDPADPAHDTWVDFHPGELVATWPAHAPVDEWVASGHWEPVAPPRRRKGGDA